MRWIERHRRAVRRAVLAAGLLIGVAVSDTGAQPQAQPTPVDLELVLAVDVSLSMDLEEQRLQRDGYIAAFRDPEVHKAITGGAQGRIAVAYMEWAGRSTQQVVLPWTLIDTPAAALDFAEKLERTPISRARLTSISAGLVFSGRLFETSGYRGIRRVIDVSGDGPNNDGPPVTGVRDDLVAKGIVINALPIMLKIGQGGSLFDISYLDQYYTECVIGGTGAFMLPIRAKDEVIPAIRRKLLLEIAGLVPVPRMIRVQAQKAPPPAPRDVDCLIGEKLWQRYMDGRFQ